MARHVKWDMDEVREQVEAEFNDLHERVRMEFEAGIDELEHLHAQEVQAFATFCELVKL